MNKNPKYNHMTFYVVKLDMCLRDVNGVIMNIY